MSIHTNLANTMVYNQPNPILILSLNLDKIIVKLNIDLWGCELKGPAQ